jgi:hypothetical protein
MVFEGFMGVYVSPAQVEVFDIVQGLDYIFRLEKNRRPIIVSCLGIVSLGIITIVYKQQAKRAREKGGEHGNEKEDVSIPGKENEGPGNPMPLLWSLAKFLLAMPLRIRHVPGLHG